jgi:hypothetical protein
MQRRCAGAVGDPHGKFQRIVVENGKDQCRVRLRARENVVGPKWRELLAECNCSSGDV